MRIAILSDIHGNLTAFEAVLADLRQTAPDLILHGGDIAANGSAPAEVLDRIRDLGWPGVLGNDDEKLFHPQSLEDFASQSKAPASMWTAIRAIAAATREALGAGPLDWLAQLPMRQTYPPLALVHASPESCWRTPAPDAAESEMLTIYGPLAQPIVVHGHTHLPSIRSIGSLTLVDSGSVGMPFDGDPRASYALIEVEPDFNPGIGPAGMAPSIRRVAYDVERELKALASCPLPGSDWTARMIRAASPQMP